MRRPVVLLCVAAAFGAGFGSSRLLERDARAQVSPLSSTVYIPSDGLVFRTFDGHVAARLSYGAHGGVFEVFDEHEQPSAGVRSGTVLAGPGRPLPGAVPGANVTPGKPDLGI
jgi:hypothetical protein